MTDGSRTGVSGPWVSDNGRRRTSFAPPPPAAEAARIRELLPFVLPWKASVLVVSNGNDALLDLETHSMEHYPQTSQGAHAGSHPANELEAVAHLQELCGTKGADYLVVPATSLWWLDHYKDLRHHLARRYRVVMYDKDLCMIYALHAPEDIAFRRQGAPDRLPLPPPEMIALTLGTYSAREFYEKSMLGFRTIRKTLRKNGLRLGSFRTILDFGCGCGRVMRRWKGLKGRRLFGADYNPYLIDWCHRTLPFASFETACEPERLSHDDDSLDFIYSLSVFTHLHPGSQRFWMGELTRVLKPGGCLYLTVLGPKHLKNLSATQRQKFEAGKMVIQREEYSGSNACTVFHPEQYVREVLAGDLDVIDFVLEAAEDLGNQNAVLLRKPLR